MSILGPQSKSGVENLSIGFQRHSCLEFHAMAYNLNAACQFHSLFGVELASKKSSWVDLNAWRGVRSTPNSDYKRRRLFDVDLNAHTCRALNSEQSTCMAFNLNASFKLDASSIVVSVECEDDRQTGIAENTVTLWYGDRALFVQGVKLVCWWYWSWRLVYNFKVNRK